jgi:curved DNA-binding protein CbpA
MSDTLSDEKIDELVSKISKGSRKTSKESKKDKEVNIEDIDFEKLNVNDKKAHIDLFSGMIDVYGIIGVSPDDAQDYIKKKCNEKLAKHHPDKMKSILAKLPEDKRVEERERMLEQYNLVKQAYNILRDPDKRKYYDLQKKTMESKNFVKQKSSFDEFIKLQESEVNETSRKNAANSFKIGFLDMDKKHNFKRSDLDEEPMTTESFNKKFTDITMSREAQDMELKMNQQNLFEGRSFNPLDFNKAWEKKKIKDERHKRGSNSDKSMTMWDGLSAANDYGLGGSNDYVSIDSDYGELYSKTNYNSSQYASKLNDLSEHSDDNCSVKSDDIDVSYVTGHNKDRSDVAAKFEQYMKAREVDDEIYQAREFGDTNAWKSVYDNPMNISSQMGTIVGKEIKTLDSRNKKNSTINKSTIDAYKQLMSDREKDLK